MTYHKPLDTVVVQVGIDAHPKVAKGGNWSADLFCNPGDPVYAVAAGKIPAVRPDELDGGTKDGTFFTIDLTREVKGKGAAVRVVYAHVVRADRKRAVVQAGEQIGTAAGHFVHIGCNLRPALEAILDAP